MEIAVRERNGRYAGNTAVWKITAKVNFIKKAMHIDEKQEKSALIE